MKKEDLEKLTKQELIDVCFVLKNDIKANGVKMDELIKDHSKKFNRLSRINELQRNEIWVHDMVLTELSSSDLLDKDDLNATINLFMNIKDAKVKS